MIDKRVLIAIGLTTLTLYGLNWVYKKYIPEQKPDITGIESPVTTDSEEVLTPASRVVVCPDQPETKIVYRDRIVEVPKVIYLDRPNPPQSALQGVGCHTDWASGIATAVGDTNTSTTCYVDFTHRRVFERRIPVIKQTAGGLRLK